MTRLLLVLAALSGCSHTTWTHGVPNFAQVEPGLYRGGEPTAEGWSYLQSLGVDVAVQLDYDEERPAGVMPPIGVVVRRFSMPPKDADDWLRGPDLALLIGAADQLRVRGRALYVHCLHGQDRTGLVVATYRRIYQGWQKADALREALAFGFHSALFGLMSAWSEVP